MEIPLATVCRITGAPRSTVYHRRRRGDAPCRRPGPRTAVSDDDLVVLIRTTITDSPFAGEGHRKVRARLRRDHDLSVGKNRVLRLMRTAGLLAPQRARRRRTPRPHDGTITTDAPNLRWGTDATMAWTRSDGWVWVFVLVDHHTDEAWCHVAKVGNRFAALQPVYDAVIDRFGRLDPDIARGIKLRHDWGSQGEFNWSLQHLDSGGVDGQASGMDEGAHEPVAPEVAGTPISSAGGRARVLASDRHRYHHRGSRSGSRRIAGGRRSLVPAPWRHADRSFLLRGPLLVIS
jgi:HTH-like domain